MPNLARRFKIEINGDNCRIITTIKAKMMAMK